ncbi:MAG: hypothetical protein OIN87_09145 [Candidatus Methanoperedens sp.]|nr:hypothetical protein [Candidatus Methanoperedens sp.]
MKTEKCLQVYNVLPADGSPLRYNRIAKKLPGMSNSTIVAALDYMVANGLIERQHKEGIKKVEYSKQPLFNQEEKKEYWEHIVSSPGTDGFDKLNFELITTTLTSHKDILLNLKTEGKTDDLQISQAIALNIALKFIETRLILTLQDYGKEPGKEKRKRDFKNELQFILLPLINDLTKLIDDIGLDKKVVTMLLYKRMHLDIQKEDLDNVLNIKDDEY